MNIVLVALNATYNHTNPAIRYLSDSLKNTKYLKSKINVISYESTINDFTYNILDDLVEKKGDVYCFSCYIWNIAKVIEIAEILKKIDKNKKIVLGGPEVSFNPESIICENDFIDFIVTGEGENALPALINNLEGSKIIRSEDFDKVEISELPFIYKEDDFNDKTKQYYYETSRGCPFFCSYCLSSATKGVSFLDVDRVKKELKIFIDNNLKQIKLVDRTFNFDDKRAIIIWQYLIDEYNKKPYNTNFHFEISGDILSKEALTLLRKAPKGIFRFEIGVQSTDKNVLESINRKSNLIKLKKNISELLLNDNITIHLDLIAGLPNESLNIFKESFNEVYTLQPHMIQLGFLKMLKGSQILNDAQNYDIEYSSIPPYEIIKSKYISYEELSFLKKIEYLVEKYYNSNQFKFSLSLLGKYYSSNGFMLYEDLVGYFEENNIFKRKISRKELLNLFFSYSNRIIDKRYNKIKNELPENMRQLSLQKQLLADLIKLDYYRFDKKGFVEGIDFNFSSNHPLLSEKMKKSHWYDTNGKWIYKKPRIEKYIFDAKTLIEEDTLIIKESFVLYDLSYDKPLIIDYTYPDVL